MVALADLYRRGTGRRPDAARAFEWYQRTEKAGHAIAQMNLGEMYPNGWGTKLDRILAWVWRH
jgi:TPR repeat protein